MDETNALQLVRRKSAAGLSHGGVLLHKRQVLFMAISSAASLKRKLLLTRISMICVKVVRVWGRLKQRASTGRREEGTRSKMVSRVFDFWPFLACLDGVVLLKRVILPERRNRRKMSCCRVERLKAREECERKECLCMRAFADCLNLL